MANAIVTLETNFALYPTVPIDIYVRPQDDVNGGKVLVGQIDIAEEDDTFIDGQVHDRFLVAPSLSPRGIALIDIQTGTVSRIDVEAMIPSRTVTGVSYVKARGDTVVAFVSLAPSSGLASHAIVKAVVDATGALDSSTVYIMAATAAVEHLATTGTTNCIDFSSLTGSIFYSCQYTAGSNIYTVQVGVTAAGAFTIYNAPFELGGAGKAVVSPDGAYAVIGRTLHSSAPAAKNAFVVNASTMSASDVVFPYATTSAQIIQPAWDTDSATFAFAHTTKDTVHIFNTAGTETKSIDLSAYAGSNTTFHYQSAGVLAISRNTGVDKILIYDVTAAPSLLASIDRPVNFTYDQNGRLDNGSVVIDFAVVDSAYTLTEFATDTDFWYERTVFLDYEFEPPEFWTRVEGAFA